MANKYLNDEQTAQLNAMLDESDAANPMPPEEAPIDEIEENEVDAINDTAAGLSEGDGQVGAEPEVQGDPNAGIPQTPALPDGFNSVDELIAAYAQMQQRESQRGDELQALREMSGELAAVAQALGNGQDLNSIDLTLDPNSPQYAAQLMKKEIADQLKPLIDKQQKNVRDRLVDRAWKQYAAEHGDVNDLMDDIKAYIGENPALSDDEHGLEVAYHMARSRKYVPEKQLMEQEDFLTRAAENPKVKEKVIEQYLNEVSRGGEGAVVSVGGGGSAVPVEKKKQMSMKDAHKAFKKMLGV